MVGSYRILGTELKPVAARLLAALLCLAPGRLPAQETDRTPVTSLRPRGLEFGCRWVPFESRALRLRMRVKDCDDPAARYVFSVEGGWVTQHRPANDVIFGSHEVIRVLSKPRGLAIEEAVRRFATAGLSAEARAACVAVPAPEAPGAAPGKQTFTLLPRPGRYKSRIEAERRDGPRDLGCGPYGAGQEERYFEYHPGEDASRYLFVVYGTDEPNFDETSIALVHRPNDWRPTKSGG